METPILPYPALKLAGVEESLCSPLLREAVRRHGVNAARLLIMWCTDIINKSCPGKKQGEELIQPSLASTLRA